jgi:predicted nucleotidyltransferase
MSETEIAEAYRGHLIYEAVVGSRAYGLAVVGSDEDRRGVFLPPTEHFWRLDRKPPETIKLGGDDRMAWEAERYIRLACQGNPTVLEVLWADAYEANDEGQMLRDARMAFIGQHLMKPYIGYATDQMHRFRKIVERGREPDWKHLMHCVRVLLQAEWLFETGFIRLDVGPHREKLLEIRAGEWTFDDVQMWTTRLLVELEGAGGHLPTGPNREVASRLLYDLREGAL